MVKLTTPQKVVRRVRRYIPLLIKDRLNVGWCSICASHTLFLEEGSWLRDQYTCSRCHSIPRQRALIVVLDESFPAWRTLQLHESSPSGPASAKLQRECPTYSASHWFVGEVPGSVTAGGRCESLESLTFPDATYDLMITQDVLEHVLRPDLAVAEIARVLRPGGAHVFTVPVYWHRPTVVRAEPNDRGGVTHVLPPDYHENPIDPDGSLVVTEWGNDFVEFVRDHSLLETEVRYFHDRHLGLDGEFLQVFITRALASP